MLLNTFLVVGLLVFTGSIRSESNADVINVKVERTIDLTSHLAKTLSLVTVENQGTKPLSSYIYVIEPGHEDKVAYIGAQLSNDGDSKENELKVSRLTQANVNKGQFYQISFKKPIESGKQETFEVEVVFTEILKPYPVEIAQNEKQLVLYTGNIYYYSQYITKTQKTVVNLASDKVESYTQLKPTSKSDQTITYGSYTTVKALEQSELKIHYENNSPFLAIKSMLRTIEISHWGNVAVEETIEMCHTGAKLKGAFSRFDYMRKQGAQSSVKSFRTILPPNSADVYYRDEIGNISTSNLKKSDRHVELELRPRFPLFGGWKTYYTVGYNLPSYQVIYSNGNNYMLKMKLVDHVYDDQLIEDLTIKIILPEHSKDFELITPYEVQRGDTYLHYTYLDTVGRPVIVIKKTNVVENHIKDFQLKYTYSRIMILQKPLVLIGVFLALFTLIMVLVRIDFSIDSTKQATTTKKNN